MTRALVPEMRDLSRTPFFAGCSPRELERADRYCTFIRVNPGRVLYRRGERPETLVILISGQAIALTSGPDVQILGPGECVGALAAAATGDCVLDAAIALSAGTIAALTARELDGLIQVCPPVAQRLRSESAASPDCATRRKQSSLSTRLSPSLTAITRKITRHA